MTAKFKIYSSLDSRNWKYEGTFEYEVLSATKPWDAIVKTLREQGRTIRFVAID